MTLTWLLRWLGGYSAALVLLYWATAGGLVPGHHLIARWSFWMAVAAVTALAGSEWVGRSARAVLPLMLAMGGSALIALAQAPPLLLWDSQERLVVRWVALSLHLGLLALAAWTSWRSLQAVRPLARLHHYLLFALGAALVAASPFAYVGIRNALWVVSPSPPANSVVPLHSHFIFRWPSTKHYGSGASISYADGTPIGHAATEGGQGWLRIYPSLLEPERELVITITSTAGSRTYRYRTAAAPDPAIGLYRAAIAHWFRPPQSGRPPSAVLLEPIAGLSHEQQAAVEDGIWAWSPATARVRGPVLSLQLQQLAPDRIRVTAHKGSWRASAEYGARLDEGRWLLHSDEAEPRARPWGPGP